LLLTILASLAAAPAFTPTAPAADAAPQAILPGLPAFRHEGVVLKYQNLMFGLRSICRPESKTSLRITWRVLGVSNVRPNAGAS